MVDLVIALDGARRRDLQFYAGDEVTISLTVYEHDGDAVPLTVTTPMLTTSFIGGDAFPIGSPFAVSDKYPGRRWYRVVGDIAGNTTTICYGLLEVFAPEMYPSGSDYGFGRTWGYPS